MLKHDNETQCVNLVNQLMYTISCDGDNTCSRIGYTKTITHTDLQVKMKLIIVPLVITYCERVVHWLNRDMTRG